MSDKIVIIHPGSLYLRIGRASDLNPEMILNCIARKRKSLDPKHIHMDTLLPQAIKTKELSAEMDESRISVSHLLQSSIQSDGRKRYGVSPNQLAQFNKRSLPEIINSSQQTFWLTPKNSVNYIVGADVLRLNPHEKFNVHFPVRRGELNVHQYAGGTLTATLEHIKCIWEFAIKNFLDINLKELNEYKAVLIISDIYNRKRVKLMAELLFEMGFKSIILSEYFHY